MRKIVNILIGLAAVYIIACNLTTPISPGELIESHADLEGTSNCTKCHILGKYVSEDKCLDCHKDLNKLIENEQGYHSSEEVQDKKCTECHSDHHGRNFKAINIDTTNFNHDITGYKLEDKHNELSCLECHKSEYIKDKKQKKAKHSYLGLTDKCSNCHADFHDETLTSSCEDCHDFKGFSPAPLFNHDDTKYPLVGKHEKTECKECHENMKIEKKEKLVFNNLKFGSCADCHTDVHQNKFGKDCSSCHNENSFQEIANKSKFDHSKTGYILEGKHIKVDCYDCHKGSCTKDLKHEKCSDCHVDYHKGRFVGKNKKSDCKDCHTVNTFKLPFFTVEQHEKTSFPLKGSHKAVACNSCHYKTNEWKFDKIGESCIDCHTDEHKGFISPKHYPQQDCKVCHNETKWTSIKFDHDKTGYKLDGKHAGVSCKSCHYRPEAGKPKQVFKNQSTDCATCHSDSHDGQFSYKGTNYCSSCHDFNDWKAKKFNHDNSRFKLDGKHKDVACAKCHVPQKSNGRIVVNYRINKLKCVDCH